MADLLDFSHEDEDLDKESLEDNDFNEEPESKEEEDERSFEDIIAEALAEDDYQDEESEEKEEESKGDDPDGQASDEDESFKSEENAKNAERRRQQEQRLMDRLKQQSPEFLLAQQLSEVYGKTPEQLMADLQEARMQKEAQAQGIPVEVQRKISAQEQRLQQLEVKEQMNDFLQWNTNIDSEMSALKTEYPMLNEAEMFQAKDYLLNTLRNTDVPLKQAVLALHGEKILAGLQEAAKNEALASISGRSKNSVIPPKSKSSNDKTTISVDESRIAKEIFNMSEEDYLKYK